MEKLIALVEKLKPFFEKVSNNKYLRAIRDGFVSCIPVILFSSLFILVASVPEIFGIKLPESVSTPLWQAYNYSMGILAVLMVATISKSLTDSINHKLPKLRQINDVSVMIVSIICLLLLAVEPIKGGMAAEFMGTKGLLSAFVVAFSVPNIYKFFVSRNITIKLPDEVPHYIAQTFADLIPLSVAVFVFWLGSLVFKNVTGMMFGVWVLELFKPLFVAADGYIGVAIIYGAMAMFWFMGIHGPSIVEPAVTAIYIANIEANLQIYSAGGHAVNILTHPTSYFVATLGGTGATLMFCAMCAFIAKSKQLKAVGRASIIPVCFAVNEPILFGAPIAYKDHKPFALIRKKGKLPRDTVEESYDLEYGSATIELHKDAIKPGDKVVIVDDLIATGGTVGAAAKLIERLGGEVVKMIFLIELTDLKGRDNLKGYAVDSVVQYEGE